MTRYYEVGRLFFSIKMNDNSAIWGRLSNYEPFLREAPAVDTIFTFSVFEHQIDAAEIEGKQLVFDEKDADPLSPKIAIYTVGHNWLFEVAPYQKHPICVRFITSSDFSSARVYMDETKMGRFAVDNAAMLLYAFRTATMHTLTMHASVTVNNGSGYLFLGSSGTGKSTHSSLWLKYIDGSWLLNDDNPVVRVLDDGEIRVFGTPWSGKTSCYKDDSAPVGAFVKLRQAPSNVIQRFKPLETYAVLYSSTSGYKEDETIADGLHETMEKIAVTIPGFILDCLPDESAARLCYDNVTQASR